MMDGTECAIRTEEGRFDRARWQVDPFTIASRQRERERRETRLEDEGIGRAATARECRTVAEREW